MLARGVGISSEVNRSQINRLEITNIPELLIWMNILFDPIPLCLFNHDRVSHNNSHDSLSARRLTRRSHIEKEVFIHELGRMSMP